MLNLGILLIFHTYIKYMYEKLTKCPIYIIFLGKNAPNVYSAPKPMRTCTAEQHTVAV